ncbi:MAG: signal peptide peptidase SppA [Planctomycetota bacterium]|nr:signal peptide peptidase SppA [Planctomycetota bacterium]
MTYPLATEPPKSESVQSTKDNRPIIVKQTGAGFLGRMWSRLLLIALLVSVVFNIGLYEAYEDYYNQTPPIERFHSGEPQAEQRIAVIDIHGMIMPPFTSRILKTIEHVQDDDRVLGVLLNIDSPGGAVADSHQIYHRLKKLAEKKPIFVSMGRIAASGGYYVAMGAGTKGRIFAEPTSWTGSIGVIIPRYNAAELAKKIGVAPDPLKTGPFKDALSPFRDLTPEERVVWDKILDESFQRFLTVISENRESLDMDGIKALATGQVYTAQQAMDNKLVDVIGYEEDALAALRDEIGQHDIRVVQYEYPVTMLESILGVQAKQQTANPWTTFLEASVPRAWYMCSWAPSVNAH